MRTDLKSADSPVVIFIEHQRSKQFSTSSTVVLLALFSRALKLTTDICSNFYDALKTRFLWLVNILILEQILLFSYAMCEKFFCMKMIKRPHRKYVVITR